MIKILKFTGPIAIKALLHMNIPSIDFDEVTRKLKAIAGKPYKIGFIRKSLLTSEWKEQEQNERARCHVQAALLYLETFVGSIDNPISQEKISATVADLEHIGKVLDGNLKLSNAILSTNTIPSTIHYKHAETLFYSRNIKREDQSTYALDLLIVYALRLALEKRVNGLLGIDMLMDQKNIPVSLSKKLKMVAGLNQICYDQSVKWDEIRLANEWMNHYIHRQMRPYPWVIYQVFEILNPILLPGKIKYGSKDVSSYYWSTVVLNETLFQKEIISYLENNFPGYSAHWDEKQEVLLL